MPSTASFGKSSKEGRARQPGDSNEVPVGKMTKVPLSLKVKWWRLGSDHTQGVCNLRTTRRRSAGGVEMLQGQEPGDESRQSHLAHQQKATFGQIRRIRTKSLVRFHHGRRSLRRGRSASCCRSRKRAPIIQHIEQRGATQWTSARLGSFSKKRRRSDSIEDTFTTKHVLFEGVHRLGPGSYLPASSFVETSTPTSQVHTSRKAGDLVRVFKI